MRITGAGRLDDCRERLRWLMVRDEDAEDYTEHHVPGTLEYRFAPKRGIPFPAFTSASAEFPELRVEAEWERDGQRIAAASATSLSEREAFSLPHDAVHSVTNPIERLTGALHIYGGDFFAQPRSEWDAETLRERPFDLERARRTFEEANRRFEAAR